MSSDGLVISLADGSKCNPINIQVYASKHPLINPVNGGSQLLVIYKEIGRLEIFIDFSHPIFTKCGLSKEQIIASEIAMYLYQERMNLSNYVEHNLSNLTWKVLWANWKDSIEISYDSIFQNVKDLLTEILLRLQENLGAKAADYFDELNINQKKTINKCIDSKWSRFIEYRRTKIKWRIFEIYTI